MVVAGKRFSTATIRNSVARSENLEERVNEFSQRLIVSNVAGASGRGQRAADHRIVSRCRCRCERHARRERAVRAQSLCRQLETRHAFWPRWPTEPWIRLWQWAQGGDRG